MKKILLLISALAMTGGAYLYAQDKKEDGKEESKEETPDRRPDRDRPRGDRPRGDRDGAGREGGGRRGGFGGFFSRMPLFKALGVNEEGEISLKELDEKKLMAALKKLDKDENGKLSRTELMGDFGGRGGRGGGGGARGGDRRRPDGEGGAQRRRPASE